MLPDEFDLTIARNERAVRARMVWRNADEAGIALLGPDESSVVTLDWARRLRARSRENADLRRRVADLSGSD